MPRQRHPHRINQFIRSREVRVIDGETEEQYGVMKTQDAQKMAKQRGLDLVEVAANATPPVCRIIDYGKFRYQQSKQEKERKATQQKTATKVKEVKFRVNIDDHDYMIKMHRAEEFLCEGNKLRIQLMFRGREMAHQELGFELMDRIREDLKTVAQVDMEPRKTGRHINMFMAPLPKQKRKPRFQKVDMGEDPMEVLDVDEDPLQEIQQEEEQEGQKS
jgi:translation initiation factor IF-3